MSYAARFSRTDRPLTVTVRATEQEAQAAKAALDQLVASLTLDELTLLAQAATKPAIKDAAVSELRKRL
jgi:hypothetical protein